MEVIDERRCFSYQNVYPMLLQNLLDTAYYVGFGLLVFLLAGYFWVLLEITLHELAHVVVGRLVGFRAYAVTIGKGRRLFQKRIGGVLCTLHLLPFGGSTAANLNLGDGLWWRGAVFSLAGVAMDGLLLFGVLKLKAQFDFDYMKGGLVKGLVGFLSPIATYQGVIIAVNLLVPTVKRDGRSIPSDGHQFFGYITGRTPKILKAMAEEYFQAVRQYDPAFTLETSWFINDERAIAEYLNAAAHKTHQEYEASAAKYEEMLKAPTMTKPEQAMLLDVLSGFAIIYSLPGFRERSIAWAKQAYELYPEAATLRGTYGASLVESGEYARAIETLTPLTEPGNSTTDTTISSLYLAKAHFHLGDAAASQAWLSKGRTDTHFKELADRIEAEMK